MFGERIAAIVIGIVAGYIGRALLSGPNPMGSIATGVSSGSSVASWAGWSSPTSSGSCDDDKLDLGGVIGAVLVTMLVLVVLGAVRGRGKTAPRT